MKRPAMISIFLSALLMAAPAQYLSDPCSVKAEEESVTSTAAVPAPVFSSASGFYGNDFELKMSAEPGMTIIYTADGSNPVNSDSAQIYTGTLTIRDRSGEPNRYAAYEENDTAQSVSRGTEYRKPTFNIDKASVIRAAAKDGEGNFSEVVSQTYFVTTGNLAQYSDSTVISIVTDPENLFDPDKGIYVTGNQYLQWKQSSLYDPEKSVWDTDNQCNYFCRGREWEREATISIFENGTLSAEQNMGIRIKGASTRNSAQKNFNLYARSEYGKSKLSLPLLPDNYSLDDGKLITKYDSISLRGINEQTRLRDEFTWRILSERKNLTTEDMKPCYLFLDGEFWGLYMITEKLSDYFIQSNYGIPKENVAMIKSGECEEGPQEETNQFFYLADKYAKMDLSVKENYDTVCSFIDIDSMIEHYAAGIYLGTYDWPNYNYGVWRNFGEAIEGNPYSDGKWRFITYDMDYTMGVTYGDFGGVEGYAYNSFKHMEKGAEYAPTSLFISLLKNPDFKSKFASVFCEYANDIFAPEKMDRIIDYYSQNYTEYIAKTTLRWWGFYGGTPDGLLPYYRNEFQTKTLGQIKTFFHERPSYSLEHMKNYLGLRSLPLKGDINEDETLTSADFILLVKYFLGKESSVNTINADMNSDGTVNIADLCLLKGKLL
ncbi:MAG: CotH kinase family protein [Oscillospiraceae bacterium]|nr:CotH kinase family protein [Oscillospiraceae bacterium]